MVRLSPLLLVLLSIFSLYIIFSVQYFPNSFKTQQSTQTNQQESIDINLRRFYDTLDHATQVLSSLQHLEDAKQKNFNKNQDSFIKINEQNVQPLRQNEVNSAQKRRESSTFESRDLCIGLAHDLQPENIAIFVTSFKRVSEGMIVLFVNSPISDSIRSILVENQVKVIEYSMHQLSPSYLQKYHPSSLRWILIDAFLKDSPNQFDRIIMVDVRDTMFQSDPFEILDNKPGFYAFHGVESKTIGECSWNSGWIKDCFGADTLKHVSHKNIICSGVSIGTTSSVEKYVELMAKTMNSEKFSKCERNGVDQGVHNVLIHTNQIPELHVLSQSKSPVANMQAHVASIINGKVFNSANELVAVVHQYDRYPELVKLYTEEYAPWKKEQLDSMKDTDCASYSIQQDIDLFKGVCDLSFVGGASNFVECCSHCNLKSNCKGFTHIGNGCWLKSCNDKKNQIKLHGATSAYKT